MSGGSGTRLRPAPHSGLPPAPGPPRSGLPQARPRHRLGAGRILASTLALSRTHCPDLIVHEVRGAQMGSGARRVPVTRRGWGPRG